MLLRHTARGGKRGRERKWSRGRANREMLVGEGEESKGIIGWREDDSGKVGDRTGGGDDWAIGERGRDGGMGVRGRLTEKKCEREEGEAEQGTEAKDSQLARDSGEARQV